MGEYAYFNKERIKIGTCERMYYLRYEQRCLVSPDQNSVNPATAKNLFFRPPFKDEDGVAPGAFKEYRRGMRLYNQGSDQGDIDASDLSPGTMQLSNESGILINVPCYHGAKLPDLGPDVKVFWNGKSWFLELVAIKNDAEKGIRPVAQCRFCREMWSFDLAEIEGYLEPYMVERIKAYQKEGI